MHRACLGLEGSQTGRNRDAFSRDHFQRASQATSYGPDGRILALFRDGVARSTAAVAKHVGLSQQASLTRLKSMLRAGLVVGIGTGPHDLKRQYILA